MVGFVSLGVDARVDRNYRCDLIFLLHSLTFLLSVLSAVLLILHSFSFQMPNTTAGLFHGGKAEN